jgi:hypothetical protein
MLFLVEAKKLIASGSCVFVKRKKNLDALALLGWTPEILFDCLCALTPKNYANGPDIDIDFPGEDVWTFGAAIESQEHYIKLKIRRLGGRGDGQALCLSFHRAEFPLLYPFKA